MHGFIWFHNTIKDAKVLKGFFMPGSNISIISYPMHSAFFTVTLYGAEVMRESDTSSEYNAQIGLFSLFETIWAKLASTLCMCPLNSCQAGKNANSYISPSPLLSLPNLWATFLHFVQTSQYFPPARDLTLPNDLSIDWHCSVGSTEKCVELRTVCLSIVPSPSASFKVTPIFSSSQSG